MLRLYFFLAVLCCAVCTLQTKSAASTLLHLIASKIVFSCCHTPTSRAALVCRRRGYAAVATAVQQQSLSFEGALHPRAHQPPSISLQPSLPAIYCRFGRRTFPVWSANSFLFILAHNGARETYRVWYFHTGCSVVSVNPRLTERGTNF